MCPPRFARRPIPGRAPPMQETVATAAQTQQWAFILSQLLDWVMAGLAWIVPFQSRVFSTILQGNSFWALAGASILLVLPAAVFVAGIWGTMVSLYTIPFRLGRSVPLLQSVALAWWDALRMVWFYWAGLVKFLIVLVGWTWGLLKLSVQLIIGTLKSAITSPLAMLDATSRRPGVPWPAFFLLIIWSMIEATIFTFTLKPTASELLGELTGYDVNGFAFITLLWLFLWVLVSGSFASIQVLNAAFKSNKYGQIVSMVAIEI